MNRISQIALPVVLLGLLVSCGGNSSLDDTEATVFLTVSIEQYNPEVVVCNNTADVVITNMEITSEPKDPNQQLTSNQDVNLTRWVITPTRADGGTTASPVWVNDLLVQVPAGGITRLSNYRVFPAEYFDDPPLSYLFPENGGFDPETGNENIRQTLTVQLFGRTVSGKAIATDPFPVAFNFRCE